ncbi:hypothetical protein CGLO_17232 [Colletotrichum gloeosporioides Cg-14]|uniref:Uncharacterized protein n=1 Tax=Colletotrichum gloeosporioides (strain Cg-14) TaxID=1237896 RepID=T0JLJ8_COLGC|nr:hypothetical protein CGLO_17232 [Colletotrichum gloeosporioides Cg-14]
MTGDNISRAQLEPTDASLREKNRQEIQRNLAQPGFHLPQPVFGFKHKHWWIVFNANPYIHKRTDRAVVAQRLINLYEACVAEAKGSPGHVTGRVNRRKVLTPDLFKRILRRLSSEDSVWEVMREDDGKKGFSYGIEVFGAGRRSFLANPMELPPMARHEEPLYIRLWATVDEWLDLTTDGNKVLIPGNSAVAAALGIPCVSIPAATAVHLANHGSADEKMMRSLRIEDGEADLMAPLMGKITSDLEDELAEDNLRMAKKIHQLESEKQTVRTELDAVRDFNGELLARESSSQWNIPGRGHQ